jgi:hypothetical protein
MTCCPKLEKIVISVPVHTGYPGPGPGEEEERFANSYLTTIRAIDPDVIQFRIHRDMLPGVYDESLDLFDEPDESEWSIESFIWD